MSLAKQILAGRLEPKATHAQGQTNQNNGQPAGESREDKVQFEGITSAELTAGDYSLDYLERLGLLTDAERSATCFQAPTSV